MTQISQNSDKKRPLARKQMPYSEEQKALFAQLKTVTNIDYRRLRSRINGMANIKSEPARLAVKAEIEADILSAQARFSARKTTQESLKLSYPDLPVSTRREEILKLIAENQVVVIAGETGSGKTTQLPKMCLELGRGARLNWAHSASPNCCSLGGKPYCRRITMRNWFNGGL